VFLVEWDERDRPGSVVGDGIGKTEEQAASNLESFAVVRPRRWPCTRRPGSIEKKGGGARTCGSTRPPIEAVKFSHMSAAATIGITGHDVPESVR
jgi:hypothetical protein